MERAQSDRREYDRRIDDRRSIVGQVIGALPGPLALLNRFSITRYLVASIVALAFDFALMMALIAMSFVPAFASAVGYSAGIVVHWLISSSFVFPGKTRKGAALQMQRAGFLASALLGLIITVGIVSVMTGAGFMPELAKAVAIIVSFFTVYLIRKYGVFK